jgi:hypothetical protein
VTPTASTRTSCADAREKTADFTFTRTEISQVHHGGGLAANDAGLSEQRAGEDRAAEDAACIHYWDEDGGRR